MRIETGLPGDGTIFTARRLTGDSEGLGASSAQQDQDHSDAWFDRSLGTPKPPKFVLERFGSITPALVGGWRIKGLLPSLGLSVVYGPPACGKSFTALDASLHVAAGREWAGRTVKPGGVIYVASEGGSGFRKRVVAARREHDLPDDLPFALVTTAPNLGVQQGDLPELVRCIREQASTLGITPCLVVLDTLARSMAGADENSSRDVGIFVANADALGRELGAAVMVVHHTGKDTDRGMRGSSALHGAADAEWEIASGDAGRTIKVAKMKDGEDGLSFSFRLNSIEVGRDEDGDPVTTMVVEVLSDPKHGETFSRKGRKALKGQRAEFVKAVALAIDDVGEIPPSSVHIPARTKCVSRQKLDAYADKLGFVQNMEPKVRKSTVDRHVRTLAGDSYLGQWGEWIWTA